MPIRKKVYVTGLGAVSCLGGDVRQLWESLLAGACGLRPLERFDLEGSPYTSGGEVVGFKPSDPAACGASLGAQMAAQAAAEALQGLPEDERGGLAVILSTNFGPSEFIEAFLDGRPEVPSGAAGPRSFGEGPFAWDVAHVAERVGAGGERVNISLSCSSGNAALAYALQLVRAGRADAALAGGYDSIQKILWAGLACMRVMAPTEEGKVPAVRPFDKDRAGTLFSEGAGVLLVESAEHAEKRGAAPLAELAGAGSNNNAFHMAHADKEGTGTAEVIRMALEDAGLTADAVDHINAHGTGTKLNDVIESRAFKAVFGQRARAIPVTSLKGALGHAMGAASVLEAVACVLSLREGVIPPTINFQTPDPECDVDLVANAPRKAKLGAVVNNAAGIGGGNAAVVLTRAN